MEEYLPALGLAWPGFRRVRGQVRKRLVRRLAALGIGDLARYRARLASDPREWAALDAICRISISRFYRDRTVFDRLRDEVLPELAVAGEPALAWSAGCASGEEPYTLAIVWRYAVLPRFPGAGLRIVATDADAGMLGRAARACYPPGTLRELPVEWREAAFDREGGLCCLRPELRAGVELRQQDLRAEAPPGPFRLVLCRNLAFTYFDEAGQRAVVQRIAERLVPGGILVVGKREEVPAGTPFFEPMGEYLYRVRHKPACGGSP